MVERSAEHRRSLAPPSENKPGLLGRRRVLGYLIAAPTLAVGVSWLVNDSDPRPADAAVPSLPQPVDVFDLGDLQNLAASPTSGLITVQMRTDGTAYFAVPRAEVGQGITTAFAMIVAEELDLPIDKVEIGLADARPELLMNQLTGGSNSMRSMYVPVRTAAAITRRRLVEVAALQWGVAVDKVTAAAGVLTGPNGLTATYGSLATAAAVTKTLKVTAELKPSSEFTVLGKP
ncbi:MAG TPA: molybdopterin cofactor-binding domain-containing protein, partial [Kribbella sp.]|nr:molybdopterin cofactor-binding domain-containing protein [Kribbella sp.]